MDEETTIAQGLHITDDSAGYDAACNVYCLKKQFWRGL